MSHWKVLLCKEKVDDVPIRLHTEWEHMAKHVLGCCERGQIIIPEPGQALSAPKVNLILF